MRRGSAATTLALAAAARNTSSATASWPEPANPSRAREARSVLDRAPFLAREPTLVAVGVRALRKFDAEFRREQVRLFAERERGIELHGGAASESLPQLEVRELAPGAEVFQV